MTRIGYSLFNAMTCLGSKVNDGTDFCYSTRSNCNFNKKHSENADTSTSVTFDLDVKVKLACHLLYCTFVPGMMSVSVIVCEI